MPKNGCLLLFFVGVTLFPDLVIHAASGVMGKEPSPSFVMVTDGLLSVNIRNYPFKKLMSKIAEQASIRIFLHSNGESLACARFSNLPLEKGLRCLTRDYSTVFIYDTRKENVAKIKEVMIFETFDRNANRKKLAGPAESVDISMKRTGENKRLEGAGRTLNQGSGRLSASVETTTETTEKVDLPHLNQLVTTGEDHQKIRAVQKLSATGDERALIPLINALQDDNDLVIKTAVDALCKMGGDNVIHALTGCLADNDERVRNAASEALNRLGSFD